MQESKEILLPGMRMAIAPGSFPGFISTEIKAPAGPVNEWSVVQHFRSVDDMRAWQRSDVHQHLLSEIGAIMGSGAFRELENGEVDSDSSVTEVIATIVKPGLEHSYREWAAKIHAIEAQFPGYRGGFCSRRSPKSSIIGRRWFVLLRRANWIIGSTRMSARNYWENMKH
jgi:uncharacterized protein